MARGLNASLTLGIDWPSEREMPRSCRLGRLSSIPTRLGGWHGELPPCLRGGVFQEVFQEGFFRRFHMKILVPGKMLGELRGDKEIRGRWKGFEREGIATSQIEILGCCNSQLKENKTSLQSVSCWHWRHEAKSPQQLKGRWENSYGRIRSDIWYIYIYISEQRKLWILRWFSSRVFFTTGFSSTAPQHAWQNGPAVSYSRDGDKGRSNDASYGSWEEIPWRLAMGGHFCGCKSTVSWCNALTSSDSTGIVYHCVPFFPKLIWWIQSVRHDLTILDSIVTCTLLSLFSVRLTQEATYNWDWHLVSHAVGVASATVLGRNLFGPFWC